jgi:hypothetical protein
MSITRKPTLEEGRIRPRRDRVRLTGDLAMRTAGIFGLTVSYSDQPLFAETQNMSPEEVDEATFHSGGGVFLDLPSDVELRIRAEDFARSDYQEDELPADEWLSEHGLDEDSEVTVFPTGLVVTDMDEVVREGQDQAEEGIWGWAVERKTEDVMEDERTDDLYDSEGPRPNR